MTASATPTFSDTSPGYIAAERDPSTGNTTFSTSNDGSSWATLGAVQTSTPGALHNSTIDIQVNMLGSINAMTGVLYMARILAGSGTNAPLVAGVDFRGDWSGVDSAGNRWALTGLTWQWVLPQSAVANLTADITAAKGSIPSVDTVTTTTYTYVLGDNGKIKDFSNAAAITVTVPPAASVAWSTPSVIEGAQVAAGQATFAPGAGVTFVAPNGLKTAKQGSSYVLRYLGSDTWLVNGDLTP